MDLLNNFSRHIADEGLWTSGTRLIVAVSGGLDSVVLCDLCERAGYDFTLAHCNFALRGKESDADAAFVSALGAQIGKQVDIRRFDTEAYAIAQKISIQVAARELRYEWFGRLVAEKGAGTKLLTAHHADDQVETVVMNFFRGTGLAGLRGMLPVQGHIIRPLLPFHRETLEAYARERKLSWREDSSNLTDTYTRNFFRHQILPLVRDRFPQAADNILNTADRLSEVEALYRESIGRYRKELFKKRGDEFHIAVASLKNRTAQATLLYELFHPYGFSSGQVTAIIELLDAETGKSVCAMGYRLLKNRNWLVLSPLQATEQVFHYLMEQVPGKVNFSRGVLVAAVFDAGKQALDTALEQASLDLSALQFPLLIRPWKEGDYFYPLGMKKKKKVARFLIDKKLSRNEKEKVWVLLSGGRLAWVIGHRIDERFKVKPSTQKVCRLEVKSL